MIWGFEVAREGRVAPQSSPGNLGKKRPRRSRGRGSRRQMRLKHDGGVNGDRGFARPPGVGTVAGLVPAPSGRLDQPFDLASGEMLAVAVIPARVSGFAPVYRFVESFPHTMPLEPAETGQACFPLSTKWTILSRNIRRRQGSGLVVESIQRSIAPTRARARSTVWQFGIATIPRGHMSVYGDKLRVFGVSFGNSWIVGGWVDERCCWVSAILRSANASVKRRENLR